MKFYTYILKSLGQQKYYTGYTSHLQQRLDEHNNGLSSYTRKSRPWKVVYHETFLSAKEAIQREKYFKSAAGRRWLKKFVNK